MPLGVEVVVSAAHAQTVPESRLQQEEPTLADFESFLNTQSPALRDLTEGQRKDLFDEYLKWRQGSSVKPKGTTVKRSSVKRASRARVARAGQVRAGRGVAVRAGARGVARPVYRRGVGVGDAAVGAAAVGPATTAPSGSGPTYGYGSSYGYAPGYGYWTGSQTCGFHPYPPCQ